MNLNDTQRLLFRLNILTFSDISLLCFILPSHIRQVTSLILSSTGATISVSIQLQARCHKVSILSNYTNMTEAAKTLGVHRETITRI